MRPMLPYQTDEIDPLCRELDEWRLRLDARGTFSRRWEGRLRRELQAAAIGASVGLEQVPVTIDEVRRILAGDRPGSVSPEDAALVTGYRDAVSFVLRRADDPAFRWDRELVVGLQDRILAGRYAAGAGRLRERTVWLTEATTGERIFLPPPHERVDGLVAEVCAIAGESDAHPAALAAWVHVACAAVHPFRDGNGRTARLLASLAMHRGEFRRPEFTSLEEWWGRHPGSYYAAFGCLGVEFDRDADVTPFVRAHVEAQLSQVRALDLKERAEARLWAAIENVADARGLAPRVANALWDVFFGRELAAGYYREVAHVSAPTATNDLAAATAARLLEARGQRRGRHYVAGPDLFGEVAADLGLAGLVQGSAGPGDARASLARSLTERFIAADRADPTALIASAWREVERELAEITRASGVEITAGLPAVALTARLVTAGAIEAETGREIARLAEVRNAAVHVEGLPPTAQAAFAYADEARQAIDRLRQSRP